MESISEKSTFETLKLLKKCEHTYEQYLAWKQPKALEPPPKRIFTFKSQTCIFELSGVTKPSLILIPEHYSLDVGYLTNPPFPQSYKLTLARLKDVLWNYTHLCTPFSFRSLVVQHCLNLKNESGFQSFGKMVIDLIIAVNDDPSRYSSQIRVYKKENICQLVFLETVGGIRTSPILTLDFRPTHQDELKEIILDHYRFLQESFNLANSGLKNLLRIIQKFAPSLLLHLSTTETQWNTAKGWMKQTHSLFDVSKPRFINEVIKYNGSVISVQPKPRPKEQDLLSRKIYFQIGEEKRPLIITVTSLQCDREICFQISLTDTNDPFFYMKTKPFDRKTWYKMLGGDYDIDPGFLTEEGVGGVIGLLKRCFSLCHTVGKFAAEFQRKSKKKAVIIFTEHLRYRPQEFLKFTLYDTKDYERLATNLTRLHEKKNEAVQEFQKYWDFIKRYKPSLLIHIPILSKPNRKPWIEVNEAHLWPESCKTKQRNLFK
ncbi:hypothetical protein HMI54_002998 [Coelomomyces lativittatus]|nr:hypothetical protein HMI54_002998 [Coelomomyces lativittatus]KAJ1514398.1 hypothetical protein HMI56_000535 [Coelomomyces lativittatus]